MTAFSHHVPPIEAVVLALFENQPSPNWCVITDGSPIGIATRNASMRAAEVRKHKMTLIEVRRPQLSDVSDACGKVLVEVAEDFQIEAIDSLPANREIYVRAGSAAAWKELICNSLILTPDQRGTSTLLKE